MNSTSNHNVTGPLNVNPKVVSYMNSTSNHNEVAKKITNGELYLI